MDQGTFDALTRSLAGGIEPRRAALRLLVGSALGGQLVRLALDDAEAKQKHGKGRDDKKRSGQLHATGKKHKKHKNDKRKNKKKDKPYEPPPPLPPGCQNCGDCEMCQDGACVPDPDLERVFCAVSESMCSYCQQGACTPFQEACDDGICPRKGYCCPGEKFCPSSESPTGFFCIKGDGCCEGKKKCGDQCIPLLSCCDQDPDSECGDCEEMVCEDGVKVCRSTCPYGAVCCQGTCAGPCRGGGTVNPETCECECPSPAPTCGWCTRPFCVEGEWKCRHSDVFEDCGGGRAGQCCPTYNPHWRCHEGYCCEFDPVWQEYYNCI